MPKQDQFSRLLDYLSGINKEPLSKDDDFALTVINFIDNQICKGDYGSRLRSILKIKFPELSPTKARDLIKLTEQIFGSKCAFDKGYWKEKLLEMALETRERAKLRNDINAIIKAEANLIKITGVDKPDLDAPFFGNEATEDGKLIDFPKEQLDVLMKLINQGSVNLNTLEVQNNNVVDIEFIEVKSE
jgi:hypothetical protein